MIHQTIPPIIPFSDSAYVDDTFIHGKQSTLLPSARRKSKTIRETKAVTCRRKSNRTASAATECMDVR